MFEQSFDTKQSFDLGHNVAAAVAVSGQSAATATQSTDFLFSKLNRSQTPSFINIGSLISTNPFVPHTINADLGMTRIIQPQISVARLDKPQISVARLDQLMPRQPAICLDAKSLCLFDTDDCGTDECGILDVPINDADVVERYDYCYDCDLPLKIFEDAIICENCGLEKYLDIEYNAEVYNMSLDGNYNGRTESSTKFVFTGTKAAGYKKAILKSCSDYTTASYQTIKKEILNRINLCAGHRLPQNVQIACIDLYFSIKENDKTYLSMMNPGQVGTKKRLVFRGNGKWGIIAACLYYACVQEGITRSPREIAEIIGVDAKYMALGDRRLHEFNELGLIDISITRRPIDDCVDKYFAILALPDSYKPIAVGLIDRAEKKYLHINNEFKLATKCLGAIYVLCGRIKEFAHITKEKIVRDCDVPNMTFVKYGDLLNKNWPLVKKAMRLKPVVDIQKNNYTQN